jgi:hypothetical protein
VRFLFDNVSHRMAFSDRSENRHIIDVSSDHRLVFARFGGLFRVAPE